MSSSCWYLLRLAVCLVLVKISWVLEKDVYLLIVGHNDSG